MCIADFPWMVFSFFRGSNATRGHLLLPSAETKTGSHGHEKYSERVGLFYWGGVQPEIAEIIRNSGVYTFGKLGCPLKNDGWKIPSFWNTRPFSGSTFNHLTGGWGGMRKSVYPLTWSNYSTRQKPPKGSV